MTAALLSFPNPPDARVCHELRTLCRDFALTAEQSARVLGRFLGTVREGRSNAVGMMEARRVLRSFESAPCDLGGAA